MLGLLLLLLLGLAVGARAASFQVAQDAFLLNGQPIQIRSGSIHYHRTHPSTWADRLRRLHAMGLNTVQTYVPWNWHSQAPGSYDFTGGRDLVAFIRAVQAEGLLLNLRAGPYICGESDFGGLPSYLLNTPGIASAADLRTNNTAYMAAVSEWWGVLLPLVAPLLIANGGPIAMTQLENEFGSYGSVKNNPADRAYMMALRALALQLLPAGSQLYTTDGNDAGYLNGGAVPGVVFATGDGSGPPWAADAVRCALCRSAAPPPRLAPSYAPHTSPTHNRSWQFNPPGWRAHINSELYPGWLTHWGEGMANISAMSTVGAISGALAVNGSYNLYMGFGGTNMGYFGGANGGGTDYEPVITSYDYNAPVEEGGGHGYGHDGDKYDAIRRINSYWAPPGEAPPPADPPAPPVAAYGPLTLPTSAGLFASLAHLGPTLPGFATPPSLESLNASSGYMLYSAVLPALPGSAFALNIAAISDFATVYVNSAMVGEPLWRPTARSAQVPLPAAALNAGGATLSVLVENMGHINYGRGWWDPKGITGQVTLNGQPLPAGLLWSATPLPLLAAQVASLPFAPGPAPAGPAFYQGTLTLPSAPADTYISLCGWGKGQIYLNGVHLGRHWAGRGPQHAYYIPAALLQQGANAITVFEHLGAPGNVSVSFGSVPDFTGAACGLSESAQPPPPAHSRHQRPLPRRAAAAPAAAAAAPLREQCKGASPPLQGTDLTIEQCAAASTPAASTTWAWVTVSGEAGILQLQANASLCAAQVGTNPSSGQPNYALAPCSKGDRTQHLLPFPSNGQTMLNPISGKCMEAFGGENSGPGSRIETYDCNGGANQGWAWDAGAPGQLVNQQGGLCLAAC